MWAVGCGVGACTSRIHQRKPVISTLMNHMYTAHSTAGELKLCTVSKGNILRDSEMAVTAVHVLLDLCVCNVVWRSAGRACQAGHHTAPCIQLQGLRQHDQSMQ
jgi:hypothetical protein